MLRCNSCGNTKTFISEARFFHWVRVDGQGNILSVDDRQGGDEAEIDFNRAYLECGECNADSVEEVI